MAAELDVTEVNLMELGKIDGGKIESSEVGEDKVGKKVQKLSKSKNLSKSKKIVGLDFLTLRERLVFIRLR